MRERMDFRIGGAGVSGRSEAWPEKVEKGTEEQECREVSEVHTGMTGNPTQCQALGQDSMRGRTVPLPESNLRSSADFLKDQLEDLGQAGVFLVLNQ